MKICLGLILIIFCINCGAVGQSLQPLSHRLGEGYKRAVFPGGDSTLKKYFLQNLKFPDSARDSNIEGRVLVRFVVNENGSISNVTVLRGIGGGCDEAARTFIKQMPPWIPATYNNCPAKDIVIQPVFFKIE